MFTLDDTDSPAVPRWVRAIRDHERDVVLRTLQQLIIDVERADSLRSLDIRLGRGGRRTLRVRLPALG